MLAPVERRSAGAVQAGARLKVADASVDAAQKLVADGGVGRVGPEGPGVIIDMTIGVLGFRGSDPLRVPQTHTIQ